MRSHFLTSLVGLSLILPALAQSTSEPGVAEVPTLEAVVVSGVQPGPGLWRVSKDGHVLWILGTLSPLPRRISWRSDKVEAIVGRSQELIESPNVAVSTNLGFFGQMMLLPSLLAARKNPDRQTLKDMVPADAYAHWLPLKQKYLGHDAQVEKRRPILAARELYEKAVKRSGLDSGALISPIVTKAAKRNKVTITQPTVKIVIENPKAMLKEIAATALDDVDCFNRTLAHIEADIETMKARGNAWATGDIEALQSLSYTDQTASCIAAVLDNAAIQKRGFADLPQRVAAAWTSAAEAALAKNTESFSLLPMQEIVKPGGFVDALRGKGYQVDAPDTEGATAHMTH
ncbi:MAG: TraB/GumN family protein [Tahibacter sp.]